MRIDINRKSFYFNYDLDSDLDLEFSLLLPLSFHQLEELLLSRSFAPNLLELLPVEAHAQVLQIYLVVCSHALEPALLLRGYCYVP